MKAEITFKDKKDLVRFTKEVQMFESDIDIHSGSFDGDAKSVLLVINCRVNEPYTLELLSEDQEEIEKFKRMISSFREVENG